MKNPDATSIAYHRMSLILMNLFTTCGVASNLPFLAGQMLIRCSHWLDTKRRGKRFRQSRRAMFFGSLATLSHQAPDVFPRAAFAERESRDPVFCRHRR